MLNPDVPNCIENLSSKQLSLSETNALLYGLNHHILPRNIDPLEIRASIDCQINKICTVNNISLAFDSKNNIREATECFIHEAEIVCNSRKNKFVHKTLRNLATNDTVKSLVLAFLLKLKISFVSVSIHHPINILSIHYPINILSIHHPINIISIHHLINILSINHPINILSINHPFKFSFHLPSIKMISFCLLHIVQTFYGTLFAYN